MSFLKNHDPDILTSKCSFQTATPSLKTRTEWCRSRRWSEPTTPPSRGPASGEPAGQPPAARQDFDGKELTCTRAPAAEAGFLHVDVKGIEESDIKLSLKKKKEKKQRKRWRSLSDVVEHCAFCDLRFFTVLTQPAGGNVCNHVTQLQSNCSIWKLLL